MTDTLILASRSPRRQELLRQIGVAFRILAADIDESRHAGESPRTYVRRMAVEKAEVVFSRERRRLPVLGADTIVLLDGDVLGKPRDAVHAAEMLGRLSGNTHSVLSAVALVTVDGECRTAVNESRVTFAELGDDWIHAYCQTGEPLDKAGAYGVQGLAAPRIAHIDGSYYGVMGLPLYETGVLLEAAGWNLLPGVGR